MTRSITLASSPQYEFALRFYAGPGFGQAGDWTEITHLVVNSVSLWYGYRSDAIVGWNASLEGIRWRDTGLGVGRTVRCDVSTRTTGGWSPYHTWFSGVVMPETVTVDYTTDTWKLTVVDALYFATRGTAPVLSVGRPNLLRDAQAIADSVNNAQLVNDPLEYTGEPSLEPEQAIDGDMTTLWISQRSPVAQSVAWDPPTLPYGISEVWKPSLAYNRGLTMWVELWGHKDLKLDLALMTRSGFVYVKEVSFGDFGKNPEPEDYGYAILCYAADTYQSLWGSATRAPVFEWKNGKPDQNLAGAISGFMLALNPDGQGDYLALADYGNIQYYPGGRSHFAWRTWLVIDGPRTQRFDSGSFVEIAPDKTWARITTAQNWAANGLAGCFIQAQSGTNAHNKHRFISGNDATSGGVTKIYFETPWTPGPTSPWTYTPQVGHTYLLHGYPVCTYTNDFPHFWDRSYGVGVNDSQWPHGASYRRNAGFFNYNDLRAWSLDMYPQPGRSGDIGDPGLSWIMVTPREIECYLSSALTNGQTTINVTSTEGLYTSGDIYLAGHVVGYTSKTVNSIVLTFPWQHGEVPPGTRVYQYDGNQATALWPMRHFKIRRKPVLLPDGAYRAISKCWVYGTLLENPRTPGDTEEPEAWRADWQNTLSPSGEAIFSTSGNEAPEIHFSVPGSTGAVRLRSVLVALAMSDGSFGRVNEIEINPPESIVNGQPESISTVAQFIRWALAQCGINGIVGSVNNIAVGEFTTDGSTWSETLNDYAKRTGHVIIADLSSHSAVIQAAPAWPAAPVLAVQDTITIHNASSVVRERRDDLSVSQVRVKVIGPDNSSAHGVYPPSPRPYGTVQDRSEVFYTSVESANNIARWVFNKSTQPIFSVVLVGPDPWLTPANDRLLLKYHLFDNDIVVQDVRHNVSLEAKRWETSFSAERFL